MVNLIQTFDLDIDKTNTTVEHLEKGVYRIVSGKTEHYFEVLASDLDAKTLTVRHNHVVYDLEFKNKLDLVLKEMGIKLTTQSLNTDVKAPMPGKVLNVAVKEGDQLSKGDTILILEAMKMENVLKAENDCSVKKVLVASSENVEKNQVLVEFDA